MRRLGHILAALILTYVAARVVNQYYLELTDLVFAAGIVEAVLSSALPDMIEPGKSSDHRGGAHSWRALIAVLLICGVGLLLMPLSLLQYHAAFFLPFGYATHLLTDALTPASLPW